MVCMLYVERKAIVFVASKAKNAKAKLLTKHTGTTASTLTFTNSSTFLHEACPKGWGTSVDG
jgi:hypothetical protein